MTDGVATEFDVALPIGRLIEATGAAGARRVVMDLIVEGFGNRADNHYYSGELLAESAPMFEGAKMYSDHLTREAERKLGGLPRSWRDVVGRITRTWVDVNEAGKKVIRGEAEIFDDQLWRLLEQATDVVGVSINARGVSRPGTADGRTAKVVEAIKRVKSVDVVSEAGAGGRILALVEAAMEESGMSKTTGASADVNKAEKSADDAPGAVDGDRVPPALQRTLADARESDEPAAETAEEPSTEDTPAAEDTAADTAASADAEPTADEPTTDTPAEAPAADTGTQVEVTAQEGGRFKMDPHRNGHDDWGPEHPSHAQRTAHEQRGDDVHPAGSQAASPNTDFTLQHAIPTAAQLAAMLESDAGRQAVETRAREMAADRIQDAVREGVAIAREEFDRQLTEGLTERDEQHARDLAQRDQRFAAAAIIEAAPLPTGSKARLKEQFFDAYFADSEQRPGMERLTEAVHTAVEQRGREIGVYVGAQVSGVGLTEGATTAHDRGKTKKTRRNDGRRTDTTDARIDAELDL